MTNPTATPNGPLPRPVYPTTCKHASAVLDTIAHAAAVSPSALSVMHISEQTATLALEYAALYARLVSGDNRLPLRADALKDDGESYDDSEYDHGRAAVPEIKMGDATVSVTWPPPPLLATEASNANAHFKTRFGDAGLPFPVQDTLQDTLQDTKQYDQVSTIFVARYTPDSDHVVKSYEPDVAAVLVATVAPHDELRAFAVGLHQWSSRRAAGVSPSDDHFGLYRLRYSSWNREADRRVRRLDTVYLPAALKAEILRDVHAFYAPETREWYAQHGVPYRRAYLLHGPPGMGKTSLVRALASELRRNCCFLSMSNISASNEELADAMSQLPPRPLVVIEDVDAVFECAGKSRLSFSALLNVMDGIMSSEGVLTVMTTNHPDRLDEAALRAGRVDRTFHLGPAEDAVIGACFRAFYKDADDAVVQRFVTTIGKAKVPEQARSIATLQELFIEMRAGSASECVEKTEAFLEQYAVRQTALKEAKEKYKRKRRSRDDSDGSANYDENEMDGETDQSSGDE